jgi:hypothetical protein
VHDMAMADKMLLHFASPLLRAWLPSSHQRVSICQNVGQQL